MTERRDGTPTTVPQPARGYSWPPFEPGNTKALVHGAYSDRAVEARAETVRGALVEVCPWLDEPTYAPAVARFVRVEARALLAHEHIVRVAEEQGFEKVSTRLLEVAATTDRLAAQPGSTLGLDPLGRARIAALASSAEATQANLTTLAAEGRRLRLARQAELGAE